MKIHEVGRDRCPYCKSMQAVEYIAVALFQCKKCGQTYSNARRPGFTEEIL